MLFIIEGLTMYLSEADIAAMLKIIHDHFDGNNFPILGEKAVD